MTYRFSVCYHGGFNEAREHEILASLGEPSSSGVLLIGDFTRDMEFSYESRTGAEIGHLIARELLDDGVVHAVNEIEEDEDASAG